MIQTLEIEKYEKYPALHDLLLRANEYIKYLNHIERITSKGMEQYLISQELWYSKNSWKISKTKKIIPFYEDLIKYNAILEKL